MKIILNKCYGGFSVSKDGYMLYAKKKGLPLYLYESDYTGNGEFIYKKSNNDKSILRSYFTKDFGGYVKINNADYEKYCLYLGSKYRKDPTLIEVVEELGDKASGFCGELAVLEIPDNCYYKIDEYDGYESIYYSSTEIFIK